MSFTAPVYDRGSWHARPTHQSLWTITSLLTVILYCAVLGFVIYSTMRGLGGEGLASTIDLGR